MASFQATAAFLGGLLIVGALASGLAQRSFLSLAALFVIAGFIVGDGGFEWVSFKAQSGFVEDLAFVALIVILFRDGLEVEGEMLQKAWHLPLRKLAIAMPITAGIVACAAHLLVGLTWTESLLLGALLSPTDPILTSSIVTNPRVPRLIRHSLNLESGLNDGLALPAVLTFLAALSSESQNFVWWHFVLQDVGLGFLFGLALGWCASMLMPRESKRPLAHPIPSHQKSLYALGVAFATYGITVLSPRGNGFIAVFVAAIVLGVRRPDLRKHFEQRADEIVEIVKLGIFVVFGALLTFDALESSGWAALGVVAVTFSGRSTGGGLDRADGDRYRRPDASVHGLVRSQGDCHDDLLPACARPAHRGGRADLRPDRPRGAVLDHRARPYRHPRRALDRQARRKNPLRTFRRERRLFLG